MACAAEENKVSTWAEFLQLDDGETAGVLRASVFRALGRDYIEPIRLGRLTYEGTAVSDKLQQTIVLDELRAVGLVGPDQQVPANIRVKHGIGNDGRRMHYYLNYSSWRAISNTAMAQEKTCSLVAPSRTGSR